MQNKIWAVQQICLKKCEVRINFSYIDKLIFYQFLARYFSTPKLSDVLIIEQEYKFKFLRKFVYLLIILCCLKQIEHSLLTIS